MIFLKTLIKLALGIAVCIFITQAYGQSCSFKTQIKYLDGTVGCIEELPLAKEIPSGESKPIIDLIPYVSSYSIAKSKNKDCKGLGLAFINDASELPSI